MCFPLAPSALCRMSPQFLNICSVKIPGLDTPRKLTLRNLLLFLQIQKLIYGISTEGDGVVTSQRVSTSAFPGVSRHICSPETLLTLEQYFSLICHCFQWAFLKTKISYTLHDSKISTWASTRADLANMSWSRSSHSMNILIDKTILWKCA